MIFTSTISAFPVLTPPVSASLRRSLQILAGLAASTAVAAFPSAALAQSSQPAPLSVLQPGSNSAAPPSSAALTTQPAQSSLSDLVRTSDGPLRVSDRPTLIFSLDEQTVLSPREQIEQNKPENSSAIHFPFGER